jgi:hypothetical protein
MAVERTDLRIFRLRGNGHEPVRSHGRAGTCAKQMWFMNSLSSQLSVMNAAAPGGAPPRRINSWNTFVENNYKTSLSRRTPERPRGREHFFHAIFMGFVLFVPPVILRPDEHNTTVYFPG